MVTTMTTMMVPTSPAYQRNSFVPLSFPKPKPSSTSPFVSPTVCLSPGFDQLPEIAHNKVKSWQLGLQYGLDKKLWEYENEIQTGCIYLFVFAWRFW